LLAVLAIPGPAAHAANNGSFAVQPTSATGSAIPRQYFVYSLPAGQVVHDSVTITNLTDRTKHFLLYGADGFSTATDGALGLRSRTDPQQGVGAWIRISRADLTLLPKRHADVPFTMTVPDDAPSGDHVGGVVALDTAIAPGSNAGVNIGVQQAIAARVYARVDGPIHAALKVDRVWLDRSHSASVHYVLTNTGNVRLGPSADISISGKLSGATRTQTQRLAGDLLPGARAEYSLALKDRLPTVDYLTVRVTASADEASATGSTTVVLLPWWVIVAAAALLLALLVALFWLVRRRRARAERPSEDAEPESVPA
ncbi:MAG: hypothetical protein ACRDQ1_04405, partial [Sciscionella sp.]